MEKVKKTQSVTRRRRENPASEVRKTVISPYPDPTLATAIFLLMGIGLVAVYSAGMMKAHAIYDSTSHFLMRQGVALGIGLALMYIAQKLPMERLESLAGIFGFVTLAVLILVFSPLGVEVKGARRWVGLGPLGRFQPSEFARLAVVLTVARYAARHNESLRTLTDVLKSLVLPGAFAGLILLQPDLDTGMMALLCGLIILFAAGIPWVYIFSLAVLTVLGAVMLIVFKDYQMARIVGFLDPYADARGKGYQIIQAWTAMGSGGFFGKGLGGSILKLGFLPEPHTDFIFAVIGEEGGFLVTSLIVALFGVLAWRGYAVAMAQSDPFSRYLAVGVTAMITLQALLNLMVVTGLAPTTGVPLPLISYGGTSFVFTAAALGILLRVSRNIPASGAS